MPDPDPANPGLSARPTRYEFLDPVMFLGDPMETAHMYDTRRIVVEWRGGDRWAITRGAGTPTMVWCEADGGWEWEPLPSSRDDEFYARCRYSEGQALTIAKRIADRIATGR